MAVKKRKKKTFEKVDGLGPKDLKNIRSAIRQIWHRSHVRNLVVKRCIGAGGFSFCEKCKRRSPKVFIDHIVRVGEVDAGFIGRMFTPSKNLQGLCKPCHDLKTKAERASAKNEKDFY